MIYVIDACTFINLVNGGALAATLAIPGNVYHVSGAVKRESKSVAETLDAFYSNGFLQQIDPSTLSASQFFALQDRFGLGDGETECLQAAEMSGYHLASDDAAARRAAAALLGANRVVGSIGLLKQAVSAGLLQPADAYTAFQAMKQSGGFLPDLPSDYFDA